MTTKITFHTEFNKHVLQFSFFLFFCFAAFEEFVVVINSNPTSL